MEFIKSIILSLMIAILLISYILFFVGVAIKISVYVENKCNWLVGYAAYFITCFIFIELAVITITYIQRG